jgi:iron complex outermembrane receptor protein
VTYRFKKYLLATTIICGAAIGAASPVYAQAAGQTADQSAATAKEDEGETIVVTGSLFRRTNTETASPVTVLNSEDLAKRGVNTVEDAVQRLSANGAGTLPVGFNGAFSAGATAPSLRGLTTASTLVLFDGQRAAYYPLADDGIRNLVDTNSIPSAIVDRIEVLKDGASSIYGADAIAGVVNIITKKQITGIHVNGSYGISDHGDAKEQRLDGTYGYGDLDDNGFNIYVSGEYQKNDALYYRDRGFPYNTANLSSICAPSLGTATIQPGTTTCRTNGIQNGIQFDGKYGGLAATTVAVVRPYNAAGTTAIAGSKYNLLNPALGCGSLTTLTLNAAQQAANPTVGAVQCQQDLTNQYLLLRPQMERLGGSARLTVQLNDDTQAYAMLNYYQNQVEFSAAPQLIRGLTPLGPSGIQYSTADIVLPIYVCAARVNCTALNGTLNPNNPFASLGQTARIFYRLADIPLSREVLAQSYRGAFGITGTFGGGWDYAVDATGMRQNLKQTFKGYIYVQHLLDVIADGSYNFMDPSKNTQAVRDYLTPDNINKAYSELYQIQASTTKDLLDLPGGPLQLALGAAFRYEKVNAPSANPETIGSPTERYFTINGFGTSGSRNVYSGYFELNAPVLDQVEVNLSGRYDSYSSGQSSFSPKVGVKFTPIPQLAFRGTYSRGFRIPSFAEAYGLPTTGFVTQTPPASFAALHGNNTYGTAAYGVGLTSIGNPDLKPEKSRNFTVGVIVEPRPGINLTVDYYNIKKTDLISGANWGPAINAYYANNGVVNIPGLTVLPGAPDPDYPNALPLLGFIQYSFINANSAKSTGIDFDIETSVNLSDTLKWRSSLEGNYVIEQSATIDGIKQRYDDTLGPYQITSASGTPKWRASWQNTLAFGNTTLSATAYYNAGYGEEAEDDGGIRGECTPDTPVIPYRDGVTPVRCRVKKFVYLDLSGSYKINEHFTLYANVKNVTNAKAPYDPSTYGGNQYNPAWAGTGIIGRYYRVGAKVDF